MQRLRPLKLSHLTPLRRMSTQPPAPPPSSNTTKYAGHPGSPEPPSPSPSPPPRLPSRLQTYAPRLHTLSERTGVPLPYLVISFLVLHELTAIIPVVGFYYLFSMMGAGAGIVGWLTSGESQEREEHTGWRGVVDRWYDEGTGKVERVGRRYGVLGYEKGSEVGSGGGGATAAVTDAVAAYVVVKALLPLRIGFSLAAAPAFARGFMRPFQRFRRIQ